MTEEELKMDLMKYKDTTTQKDELAVSLWALYHNLNLLDAKHGCNPAKVLAELKYNIMEHLEIIVAEKKEVEQDVKGDKGQDTEEGR